MIKTRHNTNQPVTDDPIDDAEEELLCLRSGVEVPQHIAGNRLSSVDDNCRSSLRSCESSDKGRSDNESWGSCLLALSVSHGAPV